MAQQERALRTRATILRAAASVFGDIGYEAATIADILREAGVTKGALYFHFSSKLELAQAVLDAQVGAVANPPEEPLMLQQMVDQGMLLAASLSVDPLLRGSVRLTVEWSGREDGPDRRVPYLRWAGVTRDFLQAAREHGEVLPHVDIDRMADLIVGCFAGIQGMSQAFTSHKDLSERTAFMYHTVMPAIAVPAVLARLDLAPDRGTRLRATADAAATAATADAAGAKEPA
ncbi:ScbR family autoregulator-binding transcription factor [Streptomyces sp. 6N223]|uniref:ScbR family autoregulator-binding transcription factor n=1 Tax=Streptomyces sp. 6N223 TaxID=3457412 RepID=UPI003FD56DB3